MSGEEITKATIFDMFYQIGEVTRSGGGKAKKKMGRINPDFNTLEEVRKRLVEAKDDKLIAYLEKLKHRKTGPPPRPKEVIEKKYI